jgi:myo-inositol-1(or 4)-monophosphatase
VDLCYVASGRLDGFFEYNLKPYDVAAGALIVTESGGNVTDFNQSNDWLFGGKIIASNGLIHQDIFEEVQNAWQIRSTEAE